jgi:hypothetical protein
MKKTNKLLLEDLQNDGYFISNEAAKGRFKEFLNYPNALGFDTESGGYLALHKGHQAGGIADEIGFCLILKAAGYRVELLDESAESGIEPDVRVNGKIYDIKRLHKAREPRNRISRLFEKTGLKGIDKIALHIDQSIKPNEMVAFLAEAMARRTKINEVLLIYEGTIYELIKQDVLKRNWLNP